MPTTWPITPLFVCGAECNVGFAGTSIATGGLRHWSTILGGFQPIAVGTGVQHIGNRSWQLSVGIGATTTDMSATHTFLSAIASGGSIVARFYVYWSAALSNSGDRIALFSTPDGLAGLEWIQFSGSMSLVAWAGNATRVEGSSVAITQNTWHRIDVRITRGTTITTEWALDGVVQSTASKASQTATTIPGFTLGQNTNGTANSSNTSCAIYLDDICVSGTSQDYPIGDGQVAGFYPTGDGTHSFASSFAFLTETGGSLVPGTTTAWQHLQNPLSSTIGVFIQAAGPASAEYMEFDFDDFPAGGVFDAFLINAIAWVSTHHSQVAGANAITLEEIMNGPILGSTFQPIVTGASYGDLTISCNYRCEASIGGSTSAHYSRDQVNQTRARWPFATDISPIPDLDGVMMEVDYIPGSPYMGERIKNETLVAMRRASVR